MSVDQDSRRDVSVIGAGMSGCMMAMYLARSGRQVDLYERRSDMRRELASAGRSINLTLAARAIAALDELGLRQSILDLTVPLKGRMIHKANGTCEFQSYGNSASDRIHSITRRQLNNALLSAVEQHANVNVHFNVTCVGLDKAKRQLLLRDEVQERSFATSPSLVIGADGCFSAVCDAIQKNQTAGRRQEFTDWGYKEILIPAASDGQHALEADTLHIWPRGGCMLLAIPNPDGSFTGTLCLPLNDNRNSFHELSAPGALQRFCKQQFPDAMVMAPDMVDGLAGARAAGFVTVSADPWHYEDWVVLVGDACHTVLPFYGQGMNAALEDCSILARQLGESNDLEQVFRQFQQTRKRNTDALAQLSRQNFVELRDAVRSPLVGYRKKVNLFLHRRFPALWTPLYTLVSHSTVPYAEAVRKAERQDRILRWSGVDLVLRAISLSSVGVENFRRYLHARKAQRPADNIVASQVAHPAGGTRGEAHTKRPANAAAGKARPRGLLDSARNVLKSLPWWAVVVVALAGVVTGGSRAGLLAVINGAINGSADQAAHYQWMFLGIALLLLGSHMVSRLLLIKLSHNVVFDMRAHLSREILGAPLRDVEKAGSPALLSSLTDDVGALSGAMLSLPNLVVHFSTIVICAAYLGWLSLAGLASLVLAVAFGAVSYRMIVSRARLRFKKSREDQNRLFQHFRALIDGNKELKLHAGRKDAFLAEGLDATASSYRAHSIAGSNIYSVGSVWGQFLFFGYIWLILFWIAGMHGIDRVGLTGVVLVLLYIMVPLELLLTATPQLARATIALENVKRIGLELSKSVSGKQQSAPPLQQRWEKLELTQLEKSYSGDSGSFRLGPINLTLQRGHLLFVMGGNGSGKSTLIKLLTGLYVPDAGQIRLENQLIEDSNREDYRQLFSAVFSDFYLFQRLHGLYSQDMDEKVHRLLVRLQLEKVVTYGNGAFSSTDLSTGQRKRLALLVMLLEDRQLCVFDEWAADQDPVFKGIFYTQLLPELKSQGKTVVVVTHDDRYSYIADRIIKLDDGQLREENPDAAPELVSAADAGMSRRFLPRASFDPQPAHQDLGILSTIGNTPLVRLRKVFGGVPFRLYAKIEAANPGGSIKDRSAWRIIEEAFNNGQITTGTTIVEASSGNMGVGLAQVCAYFGLRFVCVVDTRTTEQNIQILRAYGAVVERVLERDSATGDMLQAKLDRVKQVLAATQDSFWPNQYANRNNSRAHHKTMQEIVEQVGERIDYLFCSTSTCGTLRGCAEYVRTQGLATQIVAVDAIGSVIFGGRSCHRLLPGHGTSRVPELHDAALASRFIQVSDLDCVVGCRQLMSQEAILAGGSSGGVLMAMSKMREEILGAATCVMIFPDRGERYLNTVYSDRWVREHFGDVQLPGTRHLAMPEPVLQATDSIA